MRVKAIEASSLQSQDELVLLVTNYPRMAMYRSLISQFIKQSKKAKIEQVSVKIKLKYLML